MIVAIVGIVIVMVEASVISVFSVTGEGPVKEVPLSLKGNSQVPRSMRAVLQLCLGHWEPDVPQHTSSHSVPTPGLLLHRGARSPAPSVGDALPHLATPESVVPPLL